MQLHLWFTSF